MRHFLTAAAILALFAGAAIGQINKGNITNKMKDGIDQHDQDLNDAMNGTEPKHVAAAEAAPDSGWIERKLADGVTARLYFAHPPIAAGAKPNLPALIVIQEWWGLNEDIQERTREFAAKGYYAVAVDLYDGKSTADPKEAAALKGAMTDAGALERLKAGLALLDEEAKNGAVDAKRVAVIGWCMGGEQALKLAVADERIKAIVMFYGSPVLDVDKLKNIKGPLLGVFGKEDKGIPPATVDKLDKALTDAKITHEIHEYDGVGHAFASKAAKAMGAYNQAKAAEAWKVTWDWLDKNVMNAK